MILIDSSVWIIAWRGSNAETVQILTRLIEGEQASINPLIWTELVQGAKDSRHQKELRNLLLPIPILPFPENFWEKSAELYLKCREIGVTLTTIDSLIATHAMASRIALWSLDRVFRKIPGLKPFDLTSVP